MSLSDVRNSGGSFVDGKPSTSLVYLIHIQKTAGTSLRFYFAKGFGGKKCLWHAPTDRSESWGNLFNIAASDPDRFDKVRAIGGHIIFTKIPAEIRNKSPIFVSTLRDPVARIVSHYEHIRKQTDHQLHADVAGKTLFQALDSRGFRATSDRVQLEYLCGSKDLNRLRENLARHRFVIGKQEKIDELFHYLSTLLGLPPVDDVHVNAAKAGYEEEIEAQPDYAAAVEFIRKMNREEYEFYQSFDAVWSHI